MNKVRRQLANMGFPAYDSEAVFILVCAGVLLSFAWTMETFGCRQFGGNDMGNLVDEGYRLYLGQRPYIDFPITQPILFYLGALWALQLFGVTWPAFVHITVLFCAVTFVLQVVILRRIGISKGWTIAIAGAVQIGTLLPLSSWWYNNTTDVVVAVYCTAGVLVVRKPSDRINWVLYCATLFMASLAKPNVAGVLILACSFALALRKETRMKGLLYSLLAAVLSLGLLAIYRLNPLVVLHYYFSASGRAVPSLEKFRAGLSLLMTFWQFATLAAMLAPFIALVARRLLRAGPWRVDAGTSIILLAGIFASVFACFTNGEVRVTDTIILLTCNALLCLLTIDGGRDLSMRLPIFLQRFAIMFSMLLALWMTVTRYRVEAIGPFFEPNTHIKVGQRNAFLSQIECGPMMIGVLDGITTFLTQARTAMQQNPRLILNSIQSPGGSRFSVRTEPSVFFGPRMNWGYAAFDCKPPVGIPYSWFVGVDFPKDELPALVNNFKSADFDYCIFHSYRQGNVDLLYLPDEMVNIIFGNYEVCAEMPNAIIFAKKN